MAKRYCHKCGSEMSLIKTSIDTKWKDYELTIKGINIYKCNNEECGFEILDSEEAYKINKLAQSIASSKVSPKPDILDVSEVADLLKVSKQTIYNMIKDGRITPSFKAGREWRFIRSDIENDMFNQSDEINSKMSIAARLDNLESDINEENLELIKANLKNILED